MNRLTFHHKVIKRILEILSYLEDTTDLLSLLSESNYKIKDPVVIKENLNPVRIIFAPIIQLVWMIFLSILFYVKVHDKNKLFNYIKVFIKNSQKIILQVSPLAGRKVSFSQYFFRNLKVNSTIPKELIFRLYIESNGPTPKIFIGKKEFVPFLEFSKILIIFFIWTFYLPFKIILDKSYISRLVIYNPTAIRNFAFYNYLLRSFNLLNDLNLINVDILSTYESHGWEYSIFNSIIDSNIKNYRILGYQHAPLSYRYSDHLKRNFGFNSTNNFFLIPSGPITKEIFKFNTVFTQSIDYSCIYKSQNKDFPEIFGFEGSKFLFIPEGLEYEINLSLCFLKNLLEMKKNDCCIRVQNIYYKKAQKLFEKYKIPTSYLISSSELSLKEHCQDYNIVLGRGSSALIDVVRIGMIPLTLDDSRGTFNNVFWPVSNLIGSISSTSTREDIDKAIKISTGEISEIRRFANQYFQSININL